jgi:hypothetical protein
LLSGAEVNCNDKRNLVVAIMGAIITCNQPERQTPSIIRYFQTQLECFQWNITIEISHNKAKD